MTRRPVLSLATAVAAATVLGACADQPPTAISAAGAEASAVRLQAPAGVETTGNHLVLFRQTRVPADFGARVTRVGGRVEQASPQTGIAVVSGLSEAGARELGRSADVQSIIVEPVFTLPEPEMGEIAAADLSPFNAEAPAQAFFFPRQWHLRAIEANRAWDLGYRGSPSVVVAILDSGLSPTHPDLVGRIDLARSVSYIPQDNQILADSFPGVHPISDLQYHGTHVGATVASNAIAAAGVTSQTTLLGVKVCGYINFFNVGAPNRFSVLCPSGAVLGGITYAADSGADIINMSLGGGFTITQFPEFAAFVQRTMWYARQRNVTIVNSAGNANREVGANPEFFESYCDGLFVVCVAATGPTASAGINGPWQNVDAKAPYSNFGNLITIAAPGGGPGGSVSAACTQTSIAVPVCRTGTFVIGLSGTSMAAPHVSGVLAAMRAAQRFNGHAVTMEQLKRNADQIGDPFLFGAGRVNMFRSLTNNRFIG